MVMARDSFLTWLTMVFVLAPLASCSGQGDSYPVLEVTFDSEVPQEIKDKLAYVYVRIEKIATLGNAINDRIFNVANRDLADDQDPLRIALAGDGSKSGELVLCAIGLDDGGSDIMSNQFIVTVDFTNNSTHYLYLDHTKEDHDGDCTSPQGKGSLYDCDDHNNQINGISSEICGDGVDNNCNGLIDEGCPNS